MQDLFQMLSDTTTPNVQAHLPRQVALSVLVLHANNVEREAIVASLNDSGYIAHGVGGTMECQRSLRLRRPDILVMDPAMSDVDALAFTNQVRTDDPDIGIILITSHARLADRLAGYRNGADLYLSRPSSSEELVAAIGALSRHTHGASQPRTVTSKPLTLSTGTMQLLCADIAVDVSYTECLVLAALAASSGQRMGSAPLIEATGKPLSKSTLEVLIVRLRKKLARAGASAPAIKSIRNVGYQLCVPILIKPPISHDSSDQKELT